MKVLLFLPFAPDSPTGNAVTARRIRKNLAPLGIEVVLQHLPADSRLEEVIAAIDRERPDVLQWYNAWKTGRWLPRVRLERPLPSVITLTGTDINREAEDASHREAVLAALREAEAIVTYSAALRDHVVTLLPDLAQRVHTIPKGVELGSASFELPTWARGDVVLFFLPAGVRPEKNNRFAVRALDEVHAADPRVRLLLAGPIIDSEYGAALRQDLATRAWAGHIEGIPHDAMASVYAQAAVVLNTSLSEGLANAVIEAMACGRAVLAADIEGNRQVIEHGSTGFLYVDEADFVKKAMLLASSPWRCEELGEAGRRRALTRYSCVSEAWAMSKVLGNPGDARGQTSLVRGGPPFVPESEGVPQQRLLQVMKFLQLTRGELDQDLRTELERHPALTMRTAEAPAHDPHDPPAEAPSFEGAGKILEARSPRVGADHAGWLLGEVIARDRTDIAGKVVWEVGCGSGVLAALCAKLGAREVWATDVDEEALSLAAETARLNGVSVKVAKASLMEAEWAIRPDVVVANLPQKPVPPGMSIAVANDGGPDGTRLIVPFLEQASRRIAPGGRLYCFHHSLTCDPPILELLLGSFEILRVRTRSRIFYADEFPHLLAYWLSRRESGLCTFDDLGQGRYSFLCAALTCVRR